MRIFVKRENWEDGIWMRLPATKEEAEQVRRSLEEQHPSVMLPFIGAVDSNFPELENRLVGEIVFPAKNLDRLNQMAERLGSLNGEEEMLFQAAFRLEAPWTATGSIRRSETWRNWGDICHRRRPHSFRRGWRHMWIMQGLAGSCRKTGGI